MKWNKENIETQLKLIKIQNRDTRYDYLCKEFNAINYCLALEKYTIKLQQQNKSLNEEVDKLNYIIDKQDRDITTLSKGNKALEERIEKAIKYIKLNSSYQTDNYMLAGSEIDEILEILEKKEV